MPPANKLHLIGIGYRPLPRPAKEVLLRAEVVLASTRLFEVFKAYDEFEAVKDRIKVIDKVPATIEFIRSQLRTPNSDLKTTVLLASGDPFFFGIGRRMRDEFGADTVEILPDLSSMQTAFARIQEPWDDAFFISLHGGPDIAKRRKLPYVLSDIPRLLNQYGKLGVLTDRENNPVLIAQNVRSASADSSVELTVCERLGYADEKITRGTPAQIAGMSFQDPNVVILRKTDGKQQGPVFKFGLTEDEVEHERGLITKDEVRAVTIHKLRLPEQGVFWDIGAGSGSISLEAARLCPGLRVFAIEKESERVEAIKKNALKFKAWNIEIVRGAAPEALQELPVPDRVFIGGSGGNLDAVIRLVNQKMIGGIIIVNAASLDTLNAALSGLERNGFQTDVSEISVSRSKIIAGRRHMSALNPVFVIKGEKG